MADPIPESTPHEPGAQVGKEPAGMKAVIAAEATESVVDSAAVTPGTGAGTNKSVPLPSEAVTAALHRFLDGLLWPAVAGNVLWTLAAVMVSPSKEVQAIGRFAPALALACIGCSAAAAWSLSITQELHRDKSHACWHAVVDLLYSIGLTVSVHSIYNGSTIACYATVGSLLVAWLAHRCRIWRNEGQGRHRKRMLWAHPVLAISCLMIAWISRTCVNWMWLYALAVAVFFAFWGGSRYRARSADR